MTLNTIHLDKDYTESNPDSLKKWLDAYLAMDHRMLGVLVFGDDYDAKRIVLFLSLYPNYRNLQDSFLIRWLPSREFYDQESRKKAIAEFKDAGADYILGIYFEPPAQKEDSEVKPPTEEEGFNTLIFIHDKL